MFGNIFIIHQKYNNVGVIIIPLIRTDQSDNLINSMKSWYLGSLLSWSNWVSRRVFFCISHPSWVFIPEYATPKETFPRKKEDQKCKETSHNFERHWIVKCILVKDFYNLIFFFHIRYILNEVVMPVREKGRDLTQSYDKSPCTHRKIQKASWQHKKNATKNFDYTTIADWLRMVSWSNVQQSTPMVWLNRSTSAQPSTNRNSRVIKRTHI